MTEFPGRWLAVGRWPISMRWPSSGQRARRRPLSRRRAPVVRTPACFARFLSRTPPCLKTISTLSCGRRRMALSCRPAGDAPISSKCRSDWRFARRGPGLRTAASASLRPSRRRPMRFLASRVSRAPPAGWLASCWIPVCFRAQWGAGSGGTAWPLLRRAALSHSRLPPPAFRPSSSRRPSRPTPSMRFARECVQRGSRARLPRSLIN